MTSDQPIIRFRGFVAPGTQARVVTKENFRVIDGAEWVRMWQAEVDRWRKARDGAQEGGTDG